MIIRIEDIWLNQVKKVMLYPKEDELILQDDDLKQLCVFPALIDYFNKFPIKVFEQIESSTSVFDIPFPDSETYGLVDIRPVDKNFSQKGGSASDFLQLAIHQKSFGGLKSITRYGQRKPNRVINFNPEGLRYDYLNKRQLTNALNNLETFKTTIDHENRKVVVYNSIPCEIAITWAKYSRDFESVKHTQKLNVCKLAAAYALEYIADMGSIMEDSGQEKTFNVSELRSRIDKIREDIFNVWNELPNVFVMRGS